MSKAAPTSLSDEAQILALIDARADAMRGKRAADVLVDQTPEFVQYGLAGPLQLSSPNGFTESYVADAFEAFDGPIDYSTSEQTLHVGRDVAVSHSLARISGNMVGGGSTDLWFRKTMAYAKVDAVWKVTHEHESVPMGADGSAATDLQPPAAATTPNPADPVADQIAALSLGFDGFEIGAVIRDGVRIGYRVGGAGPAVVLMHGFPQNGYAFHQLAASLASHYRVIVIDQRGAAGSDAPAGGYDKATLAGDVRAVVEVLGERSAHIVGHDLGTTVAYAYARQYSQDVLSLSLLDGIVPGTPTFEAIVGSGQPWHFGFHKQVELAEQLIGGREAIYVDWILDVNTVKPSVHAPETRRFYVEGLRRAGGLAASLRTYAEFEADGVANGAHLAEHGKLTMPVLALGGAASLGPYMPSICGDIAENVRSIVIDDAAHFVMEEQPAAVYDALRFFLAE